MGHDTVMHIASYKKPPNSNDPIYKKNLVGTRCHPSKTSAYAATANPSRMSSVDVISCGFGFAHRRDPVTSSRK